jgi:methionyl-tRNA formyltransferase
MMGLFLAYDEYTDISSAALVSELEDIIIDVVHNPDKPRPKGEVFFGQAAKECAIACNLHVVIFI